MLTIISACEDKSIESVAQELSGQGYGALKSRATEAVIKTIHPIREKYLYYMENLDELLKIANMGAVKAQKVAAETIERAKTAMGIL